MDNQDFISAFLEWAGATRTEVPTPYLRWTCISLLAGCLANRVYTRRIEGSRYVQTFPNLYVLLLGKSGVGKSSSRAAALEVLRDCNHEQTIRLYPGKVTSASIIDAMQTGDRNDPPSYKPWRSKFYLVCDELGSDMGMGEYAGSLVKMLTRMYIGDEDIEDTTRTHGYHVVKAPYCMNWLGLTTRDWMRDVIDREAILGGFFARICITESEYGKRLPLQRSIPAGHDSLKHKLTQRLNAYLELQGEYVLTSEAIKLEDEWYMGRPVLNPDDPMFPLQRREWPLSHKLALIYAVATGSNHAIDVPHLRFAYNRIEELNATMRSVIPLASTSRDAEVEQKLLRMVRVAGSIERTSVAKVAHLGGWDNLRFKRALEMWVETGDVRIDERRQGKGATLHWQGKHE